MPWAPDWKCWKAADAGQSTPSNENRIASSWYESRVELGDGALLAMTYCIDAREINDGVSLIDNVPPTEIEMK